MVGETKYCRLLIVLFAVVVIAYDGLVFDGGLLLRVVFLEYLSLILHMIYYNNIK